MRKRILVFASGDAEGGGSGFENLVVDFSKETDPEIVAVVSNHADGGVQKRARRLQVPFLHMEKPFTAEKYQELARSTKADLVALSGWLKLVRGLDPTKTLNIHPGPLPRFGGAGMYGHFVHEAVMEAYKRGEVTDSAVTMHFVTPQFDEGPVCFVCKVPIKKDDTPHTLGKRVNEAEHYWQPKITKMVADGEISWNGDSNSPPTKVIRAIW